MKRVLLALVFILTFNSAFSGPINATNTIANNISTNSVTNVIVSWFSDGISVFNRNIRGIKASNSSSLTASSSLSSSSSTSKIIAPKAAMFFADVAGDYRSKNVGPAVWASAASWQVYDGTNWINATNYPGQFTGTYTVTIQATHTITLAPDPIVPQAMGDVIINGILSLGDGGNSNAIRYTSLNTELITIGGSGNLYFNNKTIRLTLPTNAAIIILSGGQLTTVNPCNNNKEIYIGTSLYAACTGGSSGTFTFGQVVTAGGTVNAEITVPSTNPVDICLGTIVNLTGGFNGPETNVTYQWTVRDPNSVTTNLGASGVLANETITHSTSFTPSMTGQYLVSLKITTTSNFTNVETRTINVDNVAPEALCQDITVQLDASGNGSVTTAQVDNGSNDTCGIQSLKFTGTLCGIANEGTNLTMTAPAGTVFTEILFASYGTPTGSCGLFSNGSCHAGNSKTKVENLALGNNSFTIAASNSVFGDPCGGTYKRLYVQAKYEGTSLNFDCTDIGANPVTLLVTDTSGNQSTCNATVTVEDNEIPVISDTPGNITLNNIPGSCEAVATWTTATVSDNCSATISSNYQSGDTFPLGTTTVTYTAEDAAGNQATSTSFTVTVNDNEAPEITCAANVTIDTDPGECFGTTILTPPTVTDNCTSPGNALNFGGTSDHITLGDLGDLGDLGAVTNYTIETWFNPNDTDNYNYQNLFHSFDGEGNAGIRMEMSSNWSLGQLYVYGISGAYGIIPHSDPDIEGWHHVAVVGDKDNSKFKIYFDGVLKVDVNTGSFLSSFPDFVIGRGFSTYGDRDFNGSMDEFRIWNVARTQAEIQANMSSALNTETGLIAAYHFNEGVADGNNTGITSVIDATGNENNGTLNNFALSGSSSNWTAGNVSGGPTLTNDAPATFAIGTTTTVTWTATDAAGNTATCEQIVTVADNEDPAFTCPTPAASYTADTGDCDATLDFSVTPTDNCGVASTVYSVNNTAITYPYDFPVGTTTVDILVTDIHNNTSDCSFNVIVTDDENPVLTCPTDQIVVLDASCGALMPDYTSGVATDNCSVTVTQSPTAGTPYNGDQTISVTLTANDGNGNIVDCSFNVLFDDQTAPVVVCNDITVQLDASGNYTLTQANIDAIGEGSNDACGGVTFSVNPTTFDCDDVGTPNNYALNYDGNDVVTVPDSSELRLTGDLTVEAWFKLDQNPGDWVRLVGKGNSPLRNYGLWIHPNGHWLFQQYGGGVNVSYNAPVNLNQWYHFAAVRDGNSAKLYINGVLVNTGSGSGIPHTSSDPLTIGYSYFHAYHRGQIDEVRLWDVARSDQQILDNYNITLSGGETNLIAYYNMEEASGNVLIDRSNNSHDGNLQSFTQNSVWVPSTNLLSGNQGGNNNVILTVTDSNNNVSTCTATITVEDNVAPTLTTAASDLTVQCDGNGNTTELNAWLVAIGNTGAASDACGITWSNDFTGLSDLCGETGAATVIFTATDPSNNSVTTTATFTIEDTTDPVLYGGADGAAECTGSDPALNAAYLTWRNNFAGITTDDICGAASMSYVEGPWTSDGCTDTMVVRFTSTDECGLTSFKDQTFVISDTTDPTLYGGADGAAECTGSDPQANAAYLAWRDSFAGITTTDICGASSMSYTEGNWSSDGCTDTMIVAFTATDECGLTTSQNQTFVISDTTPPALSGGANDAAECTGSDPQANAAYLAWRDSFAGITTTDICGASSMSYTEGNWSSDGCTDTMIVAFTATDECGLTTSQNQTFVISDTTPTTLSGGANDAAECTGSDPQQNAAYLAWRDNFAGITTDDICGAASMSYAEGTWTSNGCTDTMIVTFTATDECGLTTSKDQTFVISDTTNPTIDAAASDLTVECDGAGNTAQVNAWLASIGNTGAASDVCGGVVWTDDYTGLSDECGATGSALVTFTATDDCGNTSTTQATFTIEDTTAPTIDVQASDLTVECDGAGNTAQLNAWLASYGTTGAASDVCGGVVWTNNYTSLSDECGATGSALVTFTATDDCGNTSTTQATFTIEDTTAPVLTVPADVTINCEDDTSSAINGVATATDICSNFTITESDVSTQVMDNLDLGYYNYTITRTWTVVDECSNTSTFDQIITVQDVTPPVVDCNTIEVILNANGDGSITAEQLNNSSSDNCSAELFFSISEADEDFDCGDIGGDLNDLIISEYVDGANFENYIELYNGTGLTVDLSEYKLLVYYDGSATPTKYQLGGTVADRQPIVISHPGAQGFPFANNTPLITFNGDDAIALEHNGTIIDLLPVYNSTISLVGTTLIRKDTVNNGNVSSATGADGWTQVNGAPIVDLLLHDIIFKDNDHNVLLTVTDISGNISTCIASVTVIDNINPTAIAQDVTVQLDANGEGSTTADAVDDGSFDNCDIASLVLSKTAFTCEDIATNPNLVTLTVTDVNGLVSTATANVTVEDNVNPNAIAQDITVQLDASGNVSITADDVDNDTTPSNDACGIASMTVSPNAFDCDDVGPNTVTLTVRDNYDNVSTATATVTVEDNVDPVALCKPVTVTLDSSGNASITAADIDNGSNDACGIASLSLDITSFGCDDVGNPVTVKLTVTDNNNNVSTCTALVTVIGDIPTVSINDPEELPEFCQGAVLVLTTTATYADTYLWSTGETTESIEVGPAGGTFTVTVTSGTNCTATDTFTVAPFDESELLSSYTILAEDEVFLHGSNIVQTGGVGVTSNSGLIKLHQASNIIGFGRAVNFTLNQGSTIGTQIPLTANIPYPAFVPNNLSNAGSPDETINNNQSVTLNGSVYDEIVVKQGATVTFSQPNVYINDLKTFDGASIEFTQCTNVYINEKFMLAQNGKINKLSGQNVVIYVNEDVQIEKGSYVRARLHSNGNELLAKGGNANGNKAPEPTEMIGLFICKKVHGSTNVVWNADPLCDPCTPAPPSAANTDTEKGHSKFEINSWPNPSDTEFNVKIVSENTKDMISISVFDMSNKLVHSDTFSPDDVHKFGDKLEAGVYIVKVTQGPNIKTVRLVRY